MGAFDNLIVPSLCMVDVSDIRVPMIVVYKDPKDFPGCYVARVWEGAKPMPTSTMIKRESISDLRDDILAVGFSVLMPRFEGDQAHIVETWMR